MKIITVLEYYGLILALALALVLAVPANWTLAIFMFCALRVYTAHSNVNYIANSLNARDQYTLYPFVYAC